jgi:hypothetical protein
VSTIVVNVTIPVPEVKKDPTKIQTKPQLPQVPGTNQPKTAG